MKVLRTIPSFFPDVTGPAKQALKISSELEKRGIASPILTSDFKAKTSSRKERMGDVPVHRFHDFGGYMQYHFVPGVAIPLLKENYDLIHAHSYRNFLTDASFLTSKLKSKPFVMHGHGMLRGYDKFLKKKYPYVLYDISTFKIVAKKANALIVSTNQEFNECVEFGIDKDRIHIIPAGIDVGEYDRITVNEGTEKKRVLFVGRISRDRNIEQILTAFKGLLEKTQNVELCIVGGEVKRSYADKEGYLGELKILAKRLGINKNVKFVGPLYGEDLIKTYKSADIFVYTSFYENLGHVILEAAASALPIISTPVGVANDIVRSDETGYLVGYGSQELSDKLLLLLEDERKRKEFGKSVHNIVKQEYNWKAIIDRYISLYEMLLEKSF